MAACGMGSGSGTSPVESTLINPTGEFPEPLPIPQAAMAIAKLDGYTENQIDKADLERQWPQLKGQFLIDRDGIVRWANAQCAREGLGGIGKFPSAQQILPPPRTPVSPTTTSAP